ncbi:NAD-dependent epimerase [Paenibacillus albus]|uniref:NAD-dependent epimerase n=1 Tax=Paenibacillus albus TaxID=2495582 RepID=A0A3S9AC47_9BACL|nr:NAD-dependent epimerase [Paenibacillus albus]AZN43294.1 NAD-dependent epimerase [Paenibacillus albus]
MTVILVTGCAGFIGFHVARRLLEQGCTVIGADNRNDYYDVRLKDSRLNLLTDYERFHYHHISLEDTAKVIQLFEETQPQIVIHLAAQAGVRYSLDNPHVYIQSNLAAFTNILEGCRLHHIQHLLYASSSSVYGANTKTPFSTRDNVDHPVSLYAATKKANELMAHTYSHLYGLPTTGLRLFTVYGPWGRPDMAYFNFTRNIMGNRSIQVFNYGRMKRDFTYIDDVAHGIVQLVYHPPKESHNWNRTSPDPSGSYAPYRILNMGSNRPEELMSMIHHLEGIIGKKAIIEYMPMMQGDVMATYADIEDIQQLIDYRPTTSLKQGLERFVDWFLNDYSDREV